MFRAISHSEVDALLGCQARHAFAYTGKLTAGTTLSPRTAAPILREGRAWGAGVAALHAVGNGIGAMNVALQADQAEQMAAGVYDHRAHEDMLNKLMWMLGHYFDCDHRRIGLVERERELLVPLRSRTGRNRSTRYRLHAFLDGVHIDDQGRIWIVEFKLRGRLWSLEQIVLSRQIRWYAWAWREMTGSEPAGVIVDERLNEVPSTARYNKDGKVSKVQNCTPGAYRLACSDVDQEPDEEVLTKLESKVWQQRHWILLRPDELDEAGRQLTSTAELVSLMDSGALYPTRNPSPARCPSCPFKPICATPTDEMLIEALYLRAPAKRNRPALQEATA